MDLVRRKAVDLREVNGCLDGADEMLSMGFKADLGAILKGLKALI